MAGGGAPSFASRQIRHHKRLGYWAASARYAVTHVTPLKKANWANEAEPVKT